MRETLFNWLRQDLHGLHCLDLYAGSGALGFEAASRYAARVVQVDSNGAVCAALKNSCKLLDARQVEVVQMEVTRFLAGTASAFDIVFLDPPFRRGLVPACCRLLEQGGWLKADARIYIEAEREFILDGLPENWQILRAKQAGEVGYHLCQRAAGKNHAQREALEPGLNGSGGELGREGLI